jgi:predicted nucleic acid-binding protein
MALKGVLDSVMVIGLAKGGVLDRLASVFAPLYLPTAVKQEVLTGRGLAGETELAQVLGLWITEVTPSPASLHAFSATLSRADREVLAVAIAESVDLILTDDTDAHREAARYGLTCLRTTDVLLLFKRHGLVPDVRSVLDRMRQNGFGIDTALYETTLRAAGEWPTP